MAKKPAQKGKTDAGALKGFEPVSPQKSGRRTKTLAKSGYANLLPKKPKR